MLELKRWESPFLPGNARPHTQRRTPRAVLEAWPGPREAGNPVNPAADPRTPVGSARQRSPKQHTPPARLQRITRSKEPSCSAGTRQSAAER